MNVVDIRPGSITNFTHILPILDAYADTFDFSTKRRIMQLTAKIIEENPKNPSIFLAWHENVVIGFIGLQVDRENPDVAELYGQVVKHGYQGQGVGHKLLQTAIEKIQEDGVNQVRLRIKASAPPYVRRFYAKCGFKPFFDDDYTGASDEGQIMVLNLKSTEVQPVANFYAA